MQPQPAPARQEWFTQRRILALVLITGTVLTFYLCYLLLLPFLPALAWALALAILARPLHTWIVRRVKHCDLAAALSVLAVAVMLLVPAIFITHRLVVEAAHGVALVNGDKGTAMRDRLVADFPELAPAVGWVEENVDLRAEAQQIVLAVAGDFVSIVRGSIEAIIQMLLTFFMLYFFFRDRQRVLEGIRSFLPLTKDETDAAMRRVRDTVHATIYGTLVVALVQGALGGLMFWWLGLPSPVLWGAIMGLLGVGPYLGAFLVWVPAAAFLALEGMWGQAAILTAWGTLVVGVIDNVLYPILVGNRLRLHTLTAFIAIIGGLAVFGTSGLILGPVVVAVALALVDTWRLRLFEAGSVEGGLKEEELKPPVPPPTAGDGDEPRCVPEEKATAGNGKRKP